MSRYTRNISSRLGRFERQRFGGLGQGAWGFDINQPATAADFTMTPAMRADTLSADGTWGSPGTGLLTQPVTTATPGDFDPQQVIVGGVRPSQETQYTGGVGVLRSEYLTTGAAAPADSGWNWGEIGGFFTGLLGAAAPIAGGMYMGKQQAESQKDMMQLLLQGGKASAQPATVIIREGGGGGGGKSKMGLYIGLGAVGLIVLIGGIILIAR